MQGILPLPTQSRFGYRIFFRLSGYNGLTLRSQIENLSWHMAIGKVAHSTLNKNG
jgi:hypothetical protein